MIEGTIMIKEHKERVEQIRRQIKLREKEVSELESQIKDKKKELIFVENRLEEVTDRIEKIKGMRCILLKRLM